MLAGPAQTENKWALSPNGNLMQRKMKPTFIFLFTTFKIFDLQIQIRNFAQIKFGKFW